MNARVVVKRVGWLLLAFTAACAPEVPFPTSGSGDTELGQLFGLLKLSVQPPSCGNRYADDAGAAALGSLLFHDTGFSPSSCNISCASCHEPQFGYAGNTPLATGCGGQTIRNPPSILNSGFREWLAWDGHKDSLWSHAIQPLTNPVEMASTAEIVQARLQQVYASQYTAVFGNSPASEPDPNRILANFGKAVEAYERTLIRVNAPFDDGLQRFLATVGDNGGDTHDPMYLPLKVFVRAGNCITCHKGTNLTDELFHNIGVSDDGPDDERNGRAAGLSALYDPAMKLLKDVFNQEGEYSDDPNPTDVCNGKLEAIRTPQQDPAMLGAFKTASLRNVALSSPYMHNGSKASLQDVVDFYNRGGDPQGTFAGTRTSTIHSLNLTTQEKQALLQLLASLNGSETP